MSKSTSKSGCFLFILNFAKPLGGLPKPFSVRLLGWMSLTDIENEIMKLYPELYYWPWTLRIPYSKTTVIYWIKTLFFILLCLTSASGLLFAQTCPCPECGKNLIELPDTGALCENSECLNYGKLIAIQDPASLSGALKGLQLVETGSSHSSLQPGSAQWPPESLRQRSESESESEAESEAEPEGAYGGEECTEHSVMALTLQWVLDDDELVSILSMLPNDYTTKQLWDIALQFLSPERKALIEKINRHLLAAHSLSEKLTQLPGQPCREANKLEKDYLTSKKEKVEKFGEKANEYSQAIGASRFNIATTIASGHPDFGIQEVINLSDSNNLPAVSYHAASVGEVWLMPHISDEMPIMTFSHLSTAPHSSAIYIQMSFYGDPDITIIVPIVNIEKVLSHIMAHTEYTDFYAILFKDKKTDPGPDSKNPESASH